VATLKPPAKPPKNETLQVRIEESVRSKLRRYTEFIDSSESYVVSEALKLLFRKDQEFKTWLNERGHSGDQLHKRVGTLREGTQQLTSGGVDEASQSDVLRRSQ
jgi:hypothetical protein